MSVKRSEEPRPEGPTFLRLDEVRALALRNLGFGPRGSGEKHGAQLYADISPLSFRAECLRASLWACSSAGNTSVYITRLLGNVEPFLKPDPEYTRNKGSMPADSPDPKEVIRTALEELELVGDVVRLPGGYWLPAPLRCVSLHAVKRWLVVGGRPIDSLPGDFAKSLEYSGVARFATVECKGLPAESEEAWCQFPKEPVEKWAGNIIDGIALKELDDPDLKLEFYGAGIRKVVGGFDAFQLRRWTPLSASLPDGRYLARQKLFRGMIHHAIAEVKKGQVVATGSLDTTEVSVRRLMYGVDYMQGCPVRVAVTYAKESTRFVLRNEVPRPEHRLLTALARLELRADGRYYPRTWVCEPRYAAQIEKCLGRLGVGLEETKG